MTRSDTTLERIDFLIDTGAVEDAVRLAATLAKEGDAEALHLLGLWHVYGEPVTRNFGRARILFGRAADAGHQGAAIIYAVFMAIGAGGFAPDWAGALQYLRKVASDNVQAARQLALLDAMPLDPNGFPSREAELVRLSSRPQLGVVRALLSPAECAHIADLARPFLAPAIVVDPASGKSMQHPVRTSDGAVLGPIQQDLVVEAINRRIATATQTRAEHGEPLTILRYSPGQQYRPHHDCLPGESNQRVATAICYLNEDYAGGSTEFPAADINFRGKVGDMILFRNTLPNGRPDESSRHAGLPVTKGEKWIATRWIRMRDFDPWDMRRI